MWRVVWAGRNLNRLSEILGFGLLQVWFLSCGGKAECRFRVRKTPETSSTRSSRHKSSSSVSVCICRMLSAFQGGLNRLFDVSSSGLVCSWDALVLNPSLLKTFQVASYKLLDLRRLISRARCHETGTSGKKKYLESKSFFFKKRQTSSFGSLRPILQNNNGLTKNNICLWGMWALHFVQVNILCPQSKMLLLCHLLFRGASWFWCLGGSSLALQLAANWSSQHNTNSLFISHDWRVQKTKETCYSLGAEKDVWLKKYNLLFSVKLWHSGDWEKRRNEEMFALSKRTFLLDQNQHKPNEDDQNCCDTFRFR